MSNAEYVAQLEEGQLSNLIEQANARLAAIRQTGWVKLWEVSIGCGNVAWFAEVDHAAAVEFACATVKAAAAKSPGRGIEMVISLERYRPDEVQALLTDRPTANSAAGAP